MVVPDGAIFGSLSCPTCLEPLLWRTIMLQGCASPARRPEPGFERPKRGNVGKRFFPEAYFPTTSRIASSLGTAAFSAVAPSVILR